MREHFGATLQAAICGELVSADTILTQVPMPD